MAARAVVLDLDGTVWDSRPWYAGILGGGDPAATARAERDLAAGASIATLLRRRGVGKGEFRARCSAPGPCELYAGVSETLQALYRAGTPIGAATNLPAWVAEPMIESLGLDRLIAGIAHWGTTRRHKPRPDPLLAALSQLGERSGPDAWYVGDTESDQAAAKAAGMSFAWASFGYGSATTKPEAALDSFAELLRL